MVNKRTGQIARLLLALFALWQGSTLLHLALVPHALCPEGGEAVHVDHDGHPTHDHKEDHSTHHGCRHLLLLIHSNTIQADGPPAIEDAHQSAIAAEPMTTAPRPSSRELYLLSPSNSPPAAA